MVDVISNFLRSRWRLVALACLMVLVMLAAAGMSRLWIESDIDKLLRTPDPLLQQFQQRFALTDDEVFIILQSERDLLQPDVIPALLEIQNRISEMDGVRDTISLLSLRSKRRARSYLLPLLSSPVLSPDRWPTARQAVLQHPLAVGHLISADLRTTVISVRIETAYDEIQRLQAMIGQLEQIVEEQLGKIDPRYQMRQIVTGYPPLHAEMYTFMKRDQRLFIAGGLTLGLLIGWWLFRNLACVFVVNIGTNIGAMMTLSVMGMLDIPITVINTIMPVIVVIVGYADSVHMMMEIRRNLQTEVDPARAVALSVSRLWLPCFLTSLTTAIGFGSLMISRVVAVREFGALTAFGCLVNFIFVQLVLSILASYWADKIRLPPERSGGAAQERFQTTSNQIASLVRRCLGWLVIVGCCFTVASGMLCFWLRGENRLSDYIPPGSRAIESYLVLKDEFGGAGSVYALIEWDETLKINARPVLETLARTQQIMAEEPRLGPPLSLLDMLRSLPGETDMSNQYRQQFSQLKFVPREYLQVFVSTEHRQTAVNARVADIGADVLMRLVDKLQLRLDEAAVRGVTVTIVGPTVSLSRSFLQLIRDLGWSLLLATLLIFLLMAWLFRSIGLGLISALPNAFALLGAGAYLVLADTPLQMVSVLCFTVCLGISVDDTIHFLLRYLGHQRDGESAESAALNSIHEIGPALIVTTVVFVGGHAVLLLSIVPVLKTFAWLSCLCLTLAVIANLFFLPSLVIWFSRFRSAPAEPFSTKTMGSIRRQRR